MVFRVDAGVTPELLARLLGSFLLLCKNDGRVGCVSNCRGSPDGDGDLLVCRWRGWRLRCGGHEILAWVGREPRMAWFSIECSAGRAAKNNAIVSRYFEVWGPVDRIHGHSTADRNIIGAIIPSKLYDVRGLQRGGREDGTMALFLFSRDVAILTVVQGESLAALCFRFVRFKRV